MARTYDWGCLIVEEEAASNILIESGSQGVAPVLIVPDYLENARTVFGEPLSWTEQLKYGLLSSQQISRRLILRVNERLAQKLTILVLEAGDIPLGYSNWLKKTGLRIGRSTMAHYPRFDYRVPSWTDYEASVGGLSKLNPGIRDKSHPTTKIVRFEQVLRGGERWLMWEHWCPLDCCSLLGAKEIYTMTTLWQFGVAQENIDMNLAWKSTLLQVT